MSVPDLSLRLYGEERPGSAQHCVSVGRLSFAVDGMALRWIRLDDVELLRALAFVVRDADWGTYVPKIQVEKTEKPGKFSVSAEIAADTARLVCRISISASESSLTAIAQAAAIGDFQTNRAGFVVLHPASCAGQRARVKHVDGTVTEGVFPELVSPHQPFLSVQMIEHYPVPGVTIQTSFEGEVFEMEDQRNWSDASFKTYSRPLALPYPYVIRDAETARQTVHIGVSAGPAAVSRRSVDAVQIQVLDEKDGVLPLLGIGGRPQDFRGGEVALARLAALKPPLLLAELDPPGTHAGEVESLRVARAKTDARVALMVRRQHSEVKKLAALGLAPSAVALVGADAALVDETRRVFPRAQIGAGTDAFFAEFNRKPPVAADFAFWTVNPTVHAGDDASIMETLAVLDEQAATARAHCPGAKLWCGPVTLRMRFNPNATGPSVDVPRVDARQRGLFAAAFTLGQISAWAAAGLDTLVLYAPFGPRGVVHARADVQVPWWDDQPEGTVYPTYQVLAGLAPLSGRPFRKVRCSAPARLAALAMEGAVWMANLGSVPLTAAVAGEHVRMLDEESFVEAVREPDGFWSRGLRRIERGTLRLGAYAVGRVTGF